MNVNLSKTWSIPVIVVSTLYTHPRVVNYHVSVAMTTMSTDNSVTNIAYSRIRQWLERIMKDSVIIDKNHADLETWQTTGARCLVFPEDPVDQLVGIMLLSKLSAITEDSIEIGSVSVSSELDEDVTYFHAADDDAGPFQATGWWNDARPNWDNITKRRKRDTNVIAMRREPEWKDLDLEWPSDEDDGSEDDTVEIMLTEFQRDTDK